MFKESANQRKTVRISKKKSIEMKYPLPMFKWVKPRGFCRQKSRDSSPFVYDFVLRFLETEIKISAKSEFETKYGWRKDGRMEEGKKVWLNDIKNSGKNYGMIDERKSKKGGGIEKNKKKIDKSNGEKKGGILEERIKTWMKWKNNERKGGRKRNSKYEKKSMKV